MDDLKGMVETGWEPVADILRANLKDGRDLGASCCVYVDGRPMVDVWGGVADAETRRPWERDTVALVASTTKGATAICAHLLVQRGQLDLDAPVTRYWPEFGQAGKGSVPVRYLLSHQVGLPVVDAPLTFEAVCAWDPVARALAAQTPLWAPGTQHLYHAQTYGFLVGEVIRRITGKSVGAFFAEDVAQPLKLSAWIGLPEEIEPRVARPDAEPFPFDSLEAMVADFAKRMNLADDVAATLMNTVWGPDSVLSQAGTMGGAFDAETMSSRAFRAAEIPAGNMFINAASLARLYAATVSEVDGFRLLQPQTVAAMTAMQTNRSRMYGVPAALAPATANLFTMALGFMRSNPSNPMLGPASFGHPGSGGSLGAADPESRVAFGYVPNRWPAVMIDPRANELTVAVRQCLD